MSLLWILLVVVIALALFGGLGARGRRGDGVGVADGTRTRGGYGAPGIVGLLVVVVLVILLVSLLT